MKPYNKRILNALLDSYERSALFTGTNKNNISIAYPVSRKTMPEYFDESATAYEEIHACVRHLEQEGYVRVVWKKGKEDHIVQKVILCVPKVPQIYAYLKRTPKTDLLAQTTKLLRDLQEQYQTPVAAAFMGDLLLRLEEGKSVKEYVNLADSRAAERLVKAVCAIESNRRDLYIREFSILHFSDSKALEAMQAGIAKVFRRFGGRFAGWDFYDILAEHSIYHTPNFVYFKGEGTLRFESESIALKAFGQGLGISGQDLSRMKLEDTDTIRSIITIENLTTFFRWREPGSILLYLGGYLNGVRREFLKELYRQIPQADYLHFGDIDAGGFEIFEDLRRKTGIPFKPYYMDLATLKKYELYAKALTENDEARLARMKTKYEDAPYRDALEYMTRKGIKLEQECVQGKA